MRKKKRHSRQETQHEQAQVNRKGHGFRECEQSSGAGKASPPYDRSAEAAFHEKVCSWRVLLISFSTVCPGPRTEPVWNWCPINVC